MRCRFPPPVDMCPEESTQMDCSDTLESSAGSNSIPEETPGAEDFTDAEDASVPVDYPLDDDIDDDDDVPNASALKKADENQQTLVNMVTSDLQKSLYSGSELSVASSCLLLKKFRMQHRLTETAFGDLLRLISLHCPRSNQCPKSPYLFEKVFGGQKLPQEFHNFCSNCLCPEPICPNVNCQVSLVRLGSKSQFIEVPIEPQLTTILQREYNYSSLY